MKIERTKNTVINTFWGILSKVLLIVFAFIARTVLIKVLGNEYLGLNSLFTSILSVLSLAELGFGNAMIYSMYRPIAEDDTTTMNALLNLYKKIYRIIGFIILCLGLLLLPFLKYMIKGSIPEDINLQLLFLIFLFNTVSSYFFYAYKASLLAAHQRNDIDSKISTIFDIVMYISQCIILFVTKNYYAYIIVLPITTMLINIVRSIVIDKMYPQYYCEGKLQDFDMSGLKKRIFGLMLNKLCQVFRNGFDSVFISAFIGLTVLGIYNNYYYVLTSIMGFIAIIPAALQGGVGNSLIKENVEKNYQDYNKINFLYMWISGWCTICLICLYNPFMTWWVGENNCFPIHMSIVFGIYFYAMKINDVCALYRTANGLWWEDKFRPIIESIINITLNWILVKNYGVLGVLISTIIAVLMVNMPWATHILFKCYFNMSTKKYYISQLYYFFVTVIACSITFFCSCLVVLQGIGGLFIKGCICLIIPNIIFLGFYCKLSVFKDSSELVKRILKNKKGKGI